MVKIEIKIKAVNTAKNILIMLKNLPQMHLKLLKKRVIQKTAEVSGHLISNKISRSTPQNSLETLESETEIPKEIYISLGLQIIDDLRLIS